MLSNVIEEITDQELMIISDAVMMLLKACNERIGNGDELTMFNAVYITAGMDMYDEAEKELKKRGYGEVVPKDAEICVLLVQ